MPVWFEIVEAYETGALKGATTLNKMEELTHCPPGSLGKVLVHILQFEKTFKPDGEAVYSPPKRKHARAYDWPEYYKCLYALSRHGVNLEHAANLMGKYGAVIGSQVVAQFPTRDGISIAGLFQRTAHEMHAVAALASNEVITPAELAEALRESPNMPKEGLLNRARGLVKAATRKGEWKDYRKESDNGAAKD